MEVLGWATHIATGALGLMLIRYDGTIERWLGAFTLIATAFAIATHFRVP